MTIDGEDDRDLGFAVVKARTMVKIKVLDASEEPDDSFILRQDGRFRMMRDGEDSEWVDVVVPCYGHCLVARRSIHHFSLSVDQTSSYSAGYSGPIESLQLVDAHPSVLSAVLQHVGQNLRSLDIGGKITSSAIRHTLSMCPHLRDLTLNDTERSFDRILVKAYESGQCKVERIQVDEYWGYDRSSPRTRIIHELENPTSRTTQTLRELVIRDILEDEAVLVAFVRMLRVNRTLEYLNLT